MEEVVMISDVAWIPRGVPKQKPDKIKLDAQQLKELIEGGVADISDEEDDSDDEEEKPEDSMEVTGGDVPTETKKAKKGLRGSMTELNDDADAGKTVEEKYMGDFDKDDVEDLEGGMRGIAMYATSKDDPYVTEHVDTDEEEEKEDLEIRPDDNMVVLAKIQKEEYSLEVFIYNEANDDWYCHHDYPVEAPPLCLEPIQYDPGNDENGKGNLIAVGTMDSVVSIWDLDIINSATPVVTLGTPRDVENRKRKKRDGSAQGHTDAVLSLAWNKHTKHVLASGGADKQIILWDLDEAKAATVFDNRKGEVQVLVWHPVEATFLISGTMKGDVEVLDCRMTDGTVSATWQFDSEIEKIRWNHFNPFSAFVATNDGMLRHIDMRKAGEVIWEGRAHEECIGGLTLSAHTRGLLTTVGHDQLICVWKVCEDGSLMRVHSEKLHIGELHSARFNPDLATVLAIGGASDDLVRVMDLAKCDPVVQAFS